MWALWVASNESCTRRADPAGQDRAKPNSESWTFGEKKYRKCGFDATARAQIIRRSASCTIIPLGSCSDGGLAGRTAAAGGSCWTCCQSQECSALSPSRVLCCRLSLTLTGKNKTGMERRSPTPWSFAFRRAGWPGGCGGSGIGKVPTAAAGRHCCWTASHYFFVLSRFCMYVVSEWAQIRRLPTTGRRAGPRGVRRKEALELLPGLAEARRGAPIAFVSNSKNRSCKLLSWPVCLVKELSRLLFTGRGFVTLKRILFGESHALFYHACKTGWISKIEGNAVLVKERYSCFVHSLQPGFDTFIGNATDCLVRTLKS